MSGDIYSSRMFLYEHPNYAPKLKTWLAARPSVFNQNQVITLYCKGENSLLHYTDIVLCKTDKESRKLAKKSKTPVWSF